MRAKNLPKSNHENKFDAKYSSFRLARYKNLKEKNSSKY